MKKKGELPIAMADDMVPHAESAAELLKAMANPHRLQMLCLLAEGELSVGALNQLIPISQPALSQHLAVLRTDGLVHTRRESQTIYYRVAPGPTMDVIRVMHSYFCAASGMKNQNQEQSDGRKRNRQ
jgi:DNA-binding transcriptional ArsR family regulator